VASSHTTLCADSGEICKSPLWLLLIAERWAWEAYWVHEKLVELAAYEKNAVLVLNCTVRVFTPTNQRSRTHEAWRCVDYSCWSQWYEDNTSHCISHSPIWRTSTRPNMLVSRPPKSPRPLWGLGLEGWSISSQWPANDNRRRLRRCTASE